MFFIAYNTKPAFHENKNAGHEIWLVLNFGRKAGSTAHRHRFIK